MRSTHRYDRYAWINNCRDHSHGYQGIVCLRSLLQAVIALLLCTPAFSQSAEMNDIINAHKAYKGRINAIYSTYQAMNNVSDRSNSGVPRNIFLVFRKDGKYVVQPNGGAVEQPGVTLYDGKNCHMLGGAGFDPKLKRLVYSTDQHCTDIQTEGNVGVFPTPLNFGYMVDGSWICDTLQSGSFALDGTEYDPAVGTLYRVSGKHEDDHITLWFARSLGFIATKYEIRALNGMIYTFEATGFKNVQGLQFASRGLRSASYKGRPAESVYTLTNIAVKPVVLKDSAFDVTLPAGATLSESNDAGNSVYLINALGEKVLDRRFKNVNDGGKAKLLGWLFLSSLIALIMTGVAALVKRRRSVA